MTGAAREDRGVHTKGAARRTAIARAGAQVLRRAGIEGLTHRAVATEAGVPLGSTTYYFTSRDELLRASIDYGVKSSITALQEWGEANAGRDIALSLPEMLHDFLTDRRAVAMLDVEVYLLAARRPELRPYTSRWDAAFVDVVGRFVSSAVAASAVATYYGLLLMGISSDRPPMEFCEVLEQALRSMVEDDQPALPA